MRLKPWLAKMTGTKSIWSIFWSLVVILGVAVPSAGAVDYTITEIWRGYGKLGLDDGHPQIDGSGQIVWVGGDYQIYFYSQGTTTKITDNPFGGGYPMINDRGQFLWKGLDANLHSQIYLYNNGSITQITNNAFDDETPAINDSGQIVWYSRGPSGEIYSYADGIITQITNNFSNFRPDNNDYGQIVWTALDGQNWNVYLYDEGSINQITNSGHDNSFPQINDHGEIVWFGADGNDFQIYLYKNATIIQLSNNSSDNGGPRINDRGQVVWFGSDGHNDEIYLYSDGIVHQITNSNYDNFGPQINDNGQIFWVGGDGQFDQIFAYSDGTITQITNTSYNNYEPMINARGQIVWFAYEGDNLVIYEATPTQSGEFTRYDFVYSYNNGNGDYYTGYVYAPTGYHDYAVGYKQTTTDENGQTGYYEITGATDLGSDGSTAGQVYVTSYYDKESGNTYTPVSNGTAVGSSYLDSEHDYIIKSGVPEFYFGDGYYEADVGSYSRYDFIYYLNDGSGDYYKGHVYAPTYFQTSSPYLTLGQTIYNDPEGMGGVSLEGGYYYITNITDGFDSSYDKKSYITSYYYYSLGSWLGVNSDGSLTATSIYVADRSTGQESGFAIYDSQPGYFDPFSRIYSYSRFDFYYYYNDGSGDYYGGYVYAPSYLLYAGEYIYNQPHSMGGAALNGYYYISNKEYYYPSIYDKGSWVTWYYDSSFGWLGVNSDGSLTAGSIYVGDRSFSYEWGYAIYGWTVGYFDPYHSASFY
jgi:hypothetical protein